MTATPKISLVHIDMNHIVVLTMLQGVSGDSLFFFKQKTAYEFSTRLEFRRVLFRSPSPSSGETPRDPRPAESRRSRLRSAPRSEERRVGKECRSRWSPNH